MNKSSLTRIALQKAPVALVDVIAHCDEVPGNNLIHNEAILYPQELQLNALRSSSPELCVSGYHICGPTVMLLELSSNDDIASAWDHKDVCAANVIG